MAEAGDSFMSLLDDEQTPPPDIRKLNEPKDPVLAMVEGAQRQGKQVAFPNFPGAAAHVSAARYLEERAPKLAAQRAREAAGLYAGDAARAQDQQAIAQYGTTDRAKIAALKATGALEPDFAARAQIDPQWAKAAAERARAISGQGGAADMEGVGEGGPEREFRVGTGASGNPYFTNLSDRELGMEGQSTEGPRTLTNESAAPAQVRNLQPLEPGGGGGGTLSNIGGRIGAENDPARVLFQSRLEKASQIAGEPERDMTKFADLEGEGESLLKERDITTARQKLQDRLMAGEYGDRGFTPRDITGIDKLLVSRAKTTNELAQLGIDRTFYKPWHAAGATPGSAADKSEPATILNPGGAMPERDVVDIQRNKTMADRASYIDETTPRELPRTFKYANREVPPPSPKATPGVSPNPQRASTADVRLPERNPVDIFLGSIAPPDSYFSPDEALKRRMQDASDPFNIGSR